MTKIDEMIEVMQAYRDGAAIEYDRGNGWVAIDTPAWDWFNVDYRIAPIVPDSIDWSHVTDEYKYMARNEDGEAWLFTYRPITNSKRWVYDAGRLTLAETFKSYKRGTTDWSESLVERPKS